MAARQRRCECALASTDIKHAGMAVKRIGVEHFVGDEAQRRRHELAVASCSISIDIARLLGASISPIVCKSGVATRSSQQRNGICEVAVEGGMMLDHCGNARLT